LTVLKKIDACTDNTAHPFSSLFGPCYSDTQAVCFRLWAPDVDAVTLHVYNVKGNSLSVFATKVMTPCLNGWFKLDFSLSSEQLAYQFELPSGLLIPDPASRAQLDDVHGPTLLLPSSWYDLSPSSPSIKSSIPWDEHVFYELHIGAFTPDGTFRAAIEKLSHLKKLGITAIQLMPVADFPGPFNWGYDGVLLFAPDTTYGSPSDLKAFVDAAHALGIAVYLDVVYNHFGPEGNYLHTSTTPFFDTSLETPWGSAIAFSKHGLPQAEVRQFFIENALHWLNVYGFDGLRLDAVHEIYDASHPHFLTELAHVVGENTQGKNLVLEDDKSQAHYLSAYPTQESEKSFYTAEWSDDLHHCLHVMLTMENDGYYKHYRNGDTLEQPLLLLGRALTQGFSYQGDVPDGKLFTLQRGEKTSHLPLTHFVNFLQNHDQIGNRALGNRLSSQVSPDAYHLAQSVVFLAPTVPLLFMGEEWLSHQPFMFFSQLSESLNEAIREGRKQAFNYFEQFHSFESLISDPCENATFESCKLDWRGLESEQGQEQFERLKQLIEIRQKYIVPLGRQLMPEQHAFSVIGESQGGDVHWCGQAMSYGVMANFSASPIELDERQRERLKMLTIFYTSMRPSEIEILKTLPPYSFIWYQHENKGAVYGQ
jgi:malto-oligosyltrehalose trehalohydrolase